MRLSTAEEFLRIGKDRFRPSPQKAYKGFSNTRGLQEVKYAPILHEVFAKGFPREVICVGTFHQVFDEKDEGINVRVQSFGI